MRVAIPIYQTQLPSGSIRYFVRLTIAGRRVDAMLDSGSVGLRLLPRALPSRAYRQSATECAITFANGVELRGNVARIRLMLDGATAQRSTKVQIVRDVCCSSHRPNCPAEQIRKAGRIFGEGFARMGFRAVLGVGLRASGIDNPLSRFADAWIIRLPLPGDSNPGSLILGPTSYERRGFLRFELQRHRVPTSSGEAIGWQDVVPGSLTTKGPRRSIAGPIALDTGAASIVVVRSGRHPQVTEDCRDARFEFADTKQKALNLSFVINDRATPGSRTFTRPPTGRQWEGIRAGILPYHSFLVFYDRRKGVIGLKPRAGRLRAASA